MVAKRIIPMLEVQQGRVVDPSSGADLGSPATWAQRLEMEGADEVLFREVGQGAQWRAVWLEEAARCCFLPILLEASLEGPAEAASALRGGADLLLVPAGEAHRLAGMEPGRSRLATTLEVAWSAEGGWTPSPEAMAQDAPGELVLDPGPGPLAVLCAQCAHLPMPVLLRCSDPAQAAEALSHGADGILYPAALRTPAAFKSLLAGAGISLRP
jgi:hypothetical protein